MELNAKQNQTQTQNDQNTTTNRILYGQRYGYDENGRQLMVVRSEEEVDRAVDCRAIEENRFEEEEEVEVRPGGLTRRAECNPILGYADEGFEDDDGKAHYPVNNLCDQYEMNLPWCMTSFENLIDSVISTEEFSSFIAELLGNNCKIKIADNIFIRKLFAYKGLKIRFNEQVEGIGAIWIIDSRKNAKVALFDLSLVHGSVTDEGYEQLTWKCQSFIIRENLNLYFLIDSKNVITIARDCKCNDPIAISINAEDFSDDEFQDDGMSMLVMEGQSDATNTAENGSETTVISTENVELVENRDESQGVGLLPIEAPTSEIGFSLSPDQYKELTSRYNNLGTFTWEVGYTDDKIIQKIDLPFDILAKLGNNPSTLVMRQYTFFQPHITLRFQLNSTRFHSGMLVVGVRYYANSQAGDVSDRDIVHPSQIFQLDYAVLNAASSNIAELKVPFKSYLDMIPIRDTTISTGSYYATVYVGVAAPLGIGEGGSTSVSCTTQVKLECDGNATQFYGQNTALPVMEGQGFGNIISTVGGIAGTVVGMIPGVSGLGKPISAVGHLAGKLTDELVGIATRAHNDPTRLVLSSDAGPLIQYPSASFSHGIGVTPGRSLRVLPSSTTPHVPSTIPMDGADFSIEGIATKWGLISRKTISTNTPIGSQILAIPISPMLVYQDAKLGVLPTPLAGVAGMFSYFQGDLEFRFILVKADAQSVRLRFSTSPSNLPTSDEQNDQLSTIQDFQEVSELVMTAPYQGCVKQLPVLQGSDLISAGFITVRVETALVSIESCASTITLLTFVRAKPSFNLSAPRQVIWTPRISTPTPNSENIVITGGSDETTLYIFTSRDILPITPRLVMYIAAKEKVTVKFKPGYSYFLIGSDLVPEYISEGYTYPGFDVLIYSTSIYTTTPTLPIIGSNCKIRTRAADTGLVSIITRSYFNRTGLQSISPNTFEELEGQSDERTNATTESHGPRIATAPRSSEMITGEHFPLRECLQRYQSILNGRFVAERDGHHAITFDLNCGEPSARIAGERISNLTWIHDGFRFAKGSVLFQVIPHALGLSKKLMVHHIPGGTVADPIFEPEFENLGNRIPDDLTFYGHEIAATDGSIIPVNPPYYNTTNFLANGLDPRTIGTGSISAYSFGRCMISAYLHQGEEINIDVQRALGGDAEMYLFQGWPFCTNDPIYINVNEQVELSRTKGKVKKISPRYQFNNDLIKLEGQSDPKPVQRKQPSHFAVLACTPKNRAQQLGFFKYCKKMAKVYMEGQQDGPLRPQISQAHLPAVNNFVKNIIECYKNKTQFPAYIPPNLVNYIDLDVVASIKEIASNFKEEDTIEFRAHLTDLMVCLDSHFSNFPQDFFNECHAKSTGLKSASKLITGILPKSLVDKVSESEIYQAFCKGGNMLKSAYDFIMSLVTSPEKGFIILQQFRILLCASQLWVKATAFSTLMALFGFITTVKQAIMYTAVGEVLRWCTPTPTNIYLYGLPSLAGQSDMPEDIKGKVASMGAVLMGGIAATCGFASAPSWGKGITEFTRLLSTVSNGWYGLLTKTCTFIVDYIIYLLGIESPENLAIADLKALDTDVETWAQEVLVITDPSQVDIVTASPSKRQRISELYEQGSVFCRILLENKNYPKQAQTFFLLWRRLTDLYGITGEVPGSIKANTCPYVIWLAGPPGVGKSEFAKTLASKLCALMDISYDGDPFFIRNNRKYWDGCNNQPVIIFDDALQIRSPDATAQFLQDWYGLITNAPFSPEFANITEKKKLITPKLVICCANEAFPKPQGVSSLESFYRRRDMLIDVQLSEDLKKRYPNIVNVNDIRMKDDDFADFRHLSFFQYESTTNPSAKVISVPLSFKDLLAGIHPRMDMMMKRRVNSARKQLEAGSEITPERIAATREAILADLGPISSGNPLMQAASMLSETLEGQSDQKPDYELGEVDLTLPCVTRCDEVPVVCACKVPEKVPIMYCQRHGAYSCIDRSFKVIKPCVPEECVGTVSMSVIAAEARKQMRTVLGSDVDLSYLPCIVEEKGLTTNIIALCDKVHDYFSTLKKGGFKFGWYIGTALALGFVLFFFTKFMSMFDKLKDLIFGKKEEEAKLKLEPQMASSGDVKTNKQQKVQFTALKAQAAVNDLIRSTLRNRIHVTVVNERPEDCEASHGLGLAGRTFLMPYHVARLIKPESRVTIRLTTPHNEAAGKVEVMGSSLALRQVDNHDLMVVTMSIKSVPQFKRITGSFPTNKELSGLSTDLIYLSTLKGTEVPMVQQLAVKRCSQNYLCTTTNQVRELNGFFYPTSGKGLCGSVLIDPRSNRICGFHVAGNKENGAASLLCRDWFKDLECLDVEEPVLEEGGTVVPVGDFIPLGKVLDGQSVAQPLKTQIQASACVGVLGEPARKPVSFVETGEKVPGVTRLTKAVEKEGKPPLHWEPKMVRLAVEDLKNTILAKCPPVCQGVGRRSFEEAIVGRTNVPFQDALKRETSVGFPLCTLGLGTKKRHFIQYEETVTGLRVVGCRKELVSLYDVNHEKRLKGIIPYSPYMNFMKDERLKEGKLPRLINGCPLEQVIEFRRYGLDFCSAVQSKGLDVGVGVGINVHGLDWSRIATELLSVGDSIICGDYSGFGPGLDPHLVLECGEIVNAWYDKYQNERCASLLEDNRVRQTLFENLAFSTEVSRDTVIQTLCGSPSGNPFTALINSMVNLLYIRLAWLQWWEGTDLGSLTQFHRLVKVFVYGDDLIMSVDTRIRDYFNNETLQQIFASHKIVYTDADKSGTIRKFTDLSEATFLKCHFIPHPTRGKMVYLAALEKSMIEDIPNWIRTPYTDKTDVSFDNCIEAARLAYAWGFDYFNEVNDKLTSYWMERGRNFPVESWEYLDRLFFSEQESIIPALLNFSWA